ncbi:MAG: PEP-CTERM sorting domain-containing protein [Verrucomicrobia bacterium]|nr:PEP-CTERM sorting domain-containing protein [Verrucomicrobiota bacterium]
MKKLLILMIGTSVAVTSASASIYTLYTDSTSEVLADKIETDGTNIFAETVDGSGTIGDGDALRMADLSDTDKPEFSWVSSQFGGPITGWFRIDVDAQNMITPDGGDFDINLRMSDSVADDLGSKSDQLISISFEESNSVRLDGSTISGSDTSSAQSYSFLINVDPVNSYTYSFGDQVDATLPADTTLAFIDGVLADQKANPDATGFDNSLGVHRIGFIGESDSKDGMDYHFDNVILTIPEPATISLLFGALAIGWVAFRRRR